MPLADLWRRRRRWWPQPHRLPALCAERRQGLAEVRAHQHHLRRGLFVPAGPTTWRHWRSAVPDHVRRTKGNAFRARHVTDPLVRRVVARLPVLRSSVVLMRHVALSLVPPYVFWSRGTGTATVAVGVGEGAVLLSPSAGHVLRVHRTADFDDIYQDRRRTFEQHLGSPAFEVLDGGHVLREEHVHGRYFFDLTREDRLTVVRHVVAGYRSLTLAAGGGGSHTILRPILRATRQATPPADLVALLREVLSVERARTWVRVPSATDPRPKNLLIGPGLVPVPIDVGSLRLDPFFTHPVGLVASAGEHVRDSYLRGALDDDLGALFDAAGAEYRADEAGRLGLLAVRVLIASYKESSSADGVLDVPRFNWVIRRRWRAALAD